MNPRCLLIPAFTAAAVQANPQSSASYSINADVSDFGGGHSGSAAYASAGSVTDVTGISSVTAPPETARHSYIGQLYELSALQIEAPQSEVDEGGTLQLGVHAVLDDTTTIPYAATQVSWSVLNGPVSAVSPSGLVTAGPVYQNSPAGIQAAADGVAGAINLTVLNIHPDNFAAYAGDGLPDDWQVQYFGIGNPFAAPLLDPDFDGWDNLFEYRARLVPNDAASALSLSITQSAGGHSIMFAPRFTNSTYTLLGSDDLSLWLPVSGNITDAGTTRTIFDPDASRPRRYYRIEVQRP